MASPKRSLSPEGENPETKRSRTAEPEIKSSPSSEDAKIASITPSSIDPVSLAMTEQASYVSATPTLHSQSRLAIQQSIARVLQHDGFDSATPESLESFTQLVETYLESLINTSKELALSSRRDHPTPMDFEMTLKRYNISTSSLRPHIKHPLVKQDLNPTYGELITLDDGPYTTLPLLDEELSGKPDRHERPYIPKSFPEFPSKHTYKFTPQDDINIRDSKKIREQVARTAQQGEEALRGLVRASKMRKQKEVKSLVERDCYGKERFRLWETTMRRFMTGEGNGERTDAGEIADHSMIVNSDSAFSRKDVTRLGKRSNMTAKSTSVHQST
ncbi:unnamed protein product [Clonostachys byssicola]|uniref:Transcription initiation factor TFIID subunit 8 n=1 Tax=Clonostachys byssicola TaxID=160290 RepID=A0A9N9YCB1_9HYPO|nr:unnamed protein product [Clonostachys byssicola]